jgi:hypothetical protein
MARPHISNFVKELILRPSNHDSFNLLGLNNNLNVNVTNNTLKKDMKLRIELERKEKEIAGVLEDLAWKGSLEKLERFFWGGMEVPVDSLWKVLRSRCPRLKDVGTNIGRLMLDPKSEVGIHAKEFLFPEADEW